MEQEAGAAKSLLTVCFKYLLAVSWLAHSVLSSLLFIQIHLDTEALVSWALLSSFGYFIAATRGPSKSAWLPIRTRALAVACSLFFECLRRYGKKRSFFYSAILVPNPITGSLKCLECLWYSQVKVNFNKLIFPPRIKVSHSQPDQELQPRLEDQWDLVDPEINMEERQKCYQLTTINSS